MTGLTARVPTLGDTTAEDEQTWAGYELADYE
jgi:hypothetical protein